MVVTPENFETNRAFLNKRLKTLNAEICRLPNGDKRQKNLIKQKSLVEKQLLKVKKSFAVSENKRLSMEIKKRKAQIEKLSKQVKEFSEISNFDSFEDTTKLDGLHGREKVIAAFKQQKTTRKKQ